jgi:hypothetical protein
MKLGGLGGWQVGTSTYTLIDTFGRHIRSHAQSPAATLYEATDAGACHRHFP